MATVTELAVEVGTSAACQALSMPRASYYRDGRKASAPPAAAWRPSPARAARCHYFTFDAQRSDAD